VAAARRIVAEDLLDWPAVPHTHPPPDDLPAVTADAYRQVMQHWPSGVSVVTMHAPHGPHGMTASAFTSVSIAPPLVLIVVDKRWRSHDFIAGARAFTVNVLSDGQSILADRFAGREPQAGDRFAGLDVRVSERAGPILTAALAHLECVYESHHDAGDHTIFVGRVVGAEVHDPDGSPLVYHARDYARVTPISRGDPSSLR
jgi:flavin reductase (DIM6/NTAB) family NADH-FMN oxidoreductase RutF